MAGQPRKHHYVPQFYLAGFTKNDCKEGDLYVLDKEQGKTWKSTPKGSAHKRDFHAIEPKPGGDPMAVEKAMIEEELPATNLDRDGVAAVNSMTAMYANQLYSSEPEFVWTMADYRVGSASELLDALGKQEP